MTHSQKKKRWMALKSHEWQVAGRIRLGHTQTQTHTHLHSHTAIHPLLFPHLRLYSHRWHGYLHRGGARGGWRCRRSWAGCSSASYRSWAASDSLGSASVSPSFPFPPPYSKKSQLTPQDTPISNPDRFSCKYSTDRSRKRSAEGEQVFVALQETRVWWRKAAVSCQSSPLKPTPLLFCWKKKKKKKR